MSRSALRGFDSERFAAARVAAGMSRGDLARLAAPLSAVTIQRWENGTTSPQIDILRRALDRLGVAAEQVLITDPEDRFLSDYRHLRLMTQAELAGAAGLDTTTVQRLERAERPITQHAADAIAHVLEISPDQVHDAYERARTRPPGTPA
ncbi:helix-turn-helix domain-containing protein [Aldersonia kunmingensis]|uniref:helix-turn-helix domain-containing protein n=1 Tax=Aldersonia kunmingensis TaxID=408066 RepID=UPI000831B1C4|nr:helix-turn-helix transcriptional regulator [Aldersonia kunmingensis]